MVPPALRTECVVLRAFISNSIIHVKEYFLFYGTMKCKILEIGNAGFKKNSCEQMLKSKEIKKLTYYTLHICCHNSNRR
jgi:hypothetical protein